jgi:hypothetical protein
MRGTGTPMPPNDPLIYRFYELVMVNGPAWKALIEEEFGDGIMSAIDYEMVMERLPDPKGDRVKITMSGKFMPFKYYGSTGDAMAYGLVPARGRALRAAPPGCSGAARALLRRRVRPLSRQHARGGGAKRRAFARHARRGGDAPLRRPAPAPPLILLAAPLHHAGSTPVVVSPSGWHSNAVQIRDVAGFIGPATASATGPYIPGDACFLAGGARTRSSAASPMCSDLRDRCGVAAAAYAAGRIHPQR